MLEHIQSPADIKALNLQQLSALAQEIRQGILCRDSTVGGHVGPNLGIVETTIAMHYVFDAANDRFVFDVSHQSYPHKMLTGRAYGFTDTRRMQEVSGYSSPAESPVYDTFELGHTSTSISLATGLQKARDIKGSKENIVVVIGDGSLSGGEALEGLDEAAELGTGIIIIVNDNEMSIAENHGGLYRNLQLLRQTDGRAECNLFRAMGLDYRYVADGNDIESLVSVLSQLKDTQRPTVVHIHTLKGKGYAPAEKEKEQWHWSMPFDIATGEPKASGEAPTENYHDLTARFLLEEMKHDPLLVAVTSGTPTVAGFSRERREEAGKQHVDVGIAEEQAVAMISGMAKGGLHPVYNVYSTFIQRTYDQLAQDLCINHNPAVINVFLGSVFGLNDLTHIGFYDIPMMGNIPGLLYLAPTCYEEYIAMERWAIGQDSTPVAIRVPGGPVVHSDEDFDTDYSTPSFQITQKGCRVALLGLGAFYWRALDVARLLEKEGIKPTVVNPRFITHVDTALLDSLRKDHDTVVVLEDGALEGGFGEKIARYYGPTTMRTLCFGIKKGLYDRYDYQQMVRDNNLEPEQILNSIRN